jgi:hypothetical protein
MDGKSNAGDNIDLAITGASISAKLLGLVVPPAKALETIVEVIKDHRTWKRFDRLEKLSKSLERRLTQLECKPLESADIDLFCEIIAKAVSDEDKGKTELYAAFVQYWMEYKPKLASYEVRLLGNAIKELTVYEIEAFSGFIISQNPPQSKKMPEQLQEVFWNRIEYLGLFKGGTVKAAVNVTQIGRKLVEIYWLSITTAPK